MARGAIGLAGFSNEAVEQGPPHISYLMQMANLQSNRAGGTAAFKKLRLAAGQAAEAAVAAGLADTALPGRVRALPFRANTPSIHAKATRQLLEAIAAGGASQPRCHASA